MQLEIGGELTPGDLIVVPGYKCMNLGIYVKEGKGTIQYHNFGDLAISQSICNRRGIPFKLYGKAHIRNPRVSSAKLIPEVNLNEKQIETYYELLDVMKQYKII